jgi:hypothetical protein
MAKSNTGVNKSEEIRKLLKANPKMKAKDLVSALAERNIKIKEAFVYYIKGQMKGRKSRQKKKLKAAAKVVSTNGSADVLGTILKVKHLAAEVGGMQRLKALVDALYQ